jgi:hypothetical protein
VFDPEGTGYIESHRINALLEDLAFPLGYKDASVLQRQDLKNHIWSQQFPVYEDNTIHYSNLASALSAYVYALDKKQKSLLDVIRVE